ncbi:NAD(P)/FAD-dependent oxidoreductase [Streptomyces sp. NPDC086549]|uniref:flavin-dependent monooxygenase QhpG n=1 Tax=Streptomyces sp. NPDC086549 TaxID=3365752 RepID=UPI0038281613
MTDGSEAARRIHTEVCVLGAGPSGALCARRLTELGHRALLVERHPFPRPHVGEALTPAVRPLLDSLGLLRAVRDSGVLASTWSCVRWADEHVRQVRLPAGTSGFTVCRARFDQLLLDAARSVGVAVLQPARAHRPRRHAAGWEVPLTTPDGPRILRARFLVDATGRARVLGGRVTRTGPRTIALYAAWRIGTRRVPPTCLEAGPHGWLWGTLLPGGEYRVMALTDPEQLRRCGVHRSSRADFLRGLLAGSELLSELAADRPASAVAVCDATGYLDPDPVAEDRISLGEAAFAIDPLSSSGVDKALQSAMAGAVTVHTLLGAGGDRRAALAYYRDSQHASVEQHARWAGGYYAEHLTYRGNAFWRRRARPLPDPGPDSTPRPDLAALMHRRVRLAPAGRLTSTACVVGDQVIFRPALVHPALPRPVAYLGGHALAPLVASLHAGQTLAETLRTWSRTMPAEQALTVATWLYGQDLLVPQP